MRVERRTRGLSHCGHSFIRLANKSCMELLGPRSLSNNASSKPSMKESLRGSNGVLAGRKKERKKALSNGVAGTRGSARNEDFAAVCSVRALLVSLSIAVIDRHSQEWLCHFYGLVSEFCGCAVEKTNPGMRAAFSRQGSGHPHPSFDRSATGRWRRRGICWNIRSESRTACRPGW